MNEHLPRPTDDELINQSIERATEAERFIDDATARVIASQLHEGATSALYSLSSTGAIDLDRLAVELKRTHDDPNVTDEVKTWVKQLWDYALARTDSGPVDGWSKCWLSSEVEPADDPFYGLDVDDLPDDKKTHLADFLRAKGRPGAIAIEVLGIKYFLSVIDSFDEMYLGEYDSFEAYVENWLLNTDSYDFMRWVPDEIREYVKIDVEKMGEDWLENGYYARQVDDTCYVFDFRR